MMHWQHGCLAGETRRFIWACECILILQWKSKQRYIFFKWNRAWKCCHSAFYGILPLAMRLMEEYCWTKASTYGIQVLNWTFDWRENKANTKCVGAHCQNTCSTMSRFASSLQLQSKLAEAHDGIMCWFCASFAVARLNRNIPTVRSVNSSPDTNPYDLQDSRHITWCPVWGHLRPDLKQFLMLRISGASTLVVRHLLLMWSLPRSQWSGWTCSILLILVHCTSHCTACQI